MKLHYTTENSDMQTNMYYTVSYTFFGLLMYSAFMTLNPSFPLHSPDDRHLCAW